MKNGVWNITIDSVDVKIADLAARRNELFQANERAVLATISLEKHRHDKLMDQNFPWGKNELIRKAQLESWNSTHMDSLIAAETALRKARLDYEIAELEMKKLNFYMRIAEVDAQNMNMAGHNPEIGGG